jgi:ATP-dependent Clp protease adaptor protein ClpS
MPLPCPTTEVLIANHAVAAPRWHVVLLDDPNHSFAYVIDLLVDVFGRSLSDAHALTEEVHRMGKAIAVTCSLERAELYREQVLGYGDDPFMHVLRGTASGPLGCVLEAADPQA